MHLSIAYAPPIQYFSKLLGERTAYIEAHESYLKQTWRNRCHIAGPDGLVELSIPIVSGAASGCPIREARLSEHGRWRHQHWQAIRSAYGSSAFFEYYADKIAPLYTQKHEYLWDFNLELLQILLSCLDIDTQIALTTSYEKDVPSDFRTAINPKRPEVDPHFLPVSYYQTFSDRHGFLPNLSVLDLLFEMGPEAILVLKRSVI